MFWVNSVNEKNQETHLYGDRHLVQDSYHRGYDGHVTVRFPFSRKENLRIFRLRLRSFGQHRTD